ncbi:hypothetical protein BLNAU_8093 [Blattamonas nauphoetae]|uniref:Uncharacterized protein n=1 Tax=Blattamonas nauphoetae TaxID=2049346 RepID=A0ABQ9XZU1_9EUKA|nr:hypothetical protein BLNAU_8093 [Blattamonas nauphoetae]
MLRNKTSSKPKLYNPIVKQTNLVEVFLRQICGECEPLRPVMLNGLLALATESDWALSAILEVEYITPLEEYCEKTQPCEVPISLPKLLYLIGQSSESECVRICESSIPSFFLECGILTKSNNVNTEIGNCLLLWNSTLRSSTTFLTHYKTQFLAFINHFVRNKSDLRDLSVFTKLCFYPHLQVSMIALQALSIRCETDSKTRDFLQKHKVPSCSTDSSSELVPFAGRLCGRLAERVSEMKSLFSESSPSDGTISALSSTLPEESPLLTGNHVVDILLEELFLLSTLLCDMDNTFHTVCLFFSHLVQILIDCDFVPLLKSTIIACLDLLDRQQSESNCPPSDRTHMLIDILSISWNCASCCLRSINSSLHPVVESTFSDIPQLCTLLERTCRFSSSTHSSHLTMIVNVAATLPRMVPRMLEENLVKRVIDTSEPIRVPPTNGDFQLFLIWAINNLVGDPKDITQNKEERTRIRMLQFKQVLTPAKPYLQFILQREEFIPKAKLGNYDFSSQIGHLLGKTFVLERDLFESGEIVETGREEWEVGWLVEKTDEKDLGERLKMIWADDVEVKNKTKARWKTRVERRREAGHEDAMEGWLTRMDNETPSDIVDYLRLICIMNGINISILTKWRYYGFWM